MKKSEVRITKVEEDTIGGDTYWIKKHGAEKAFPLCFRPKSDGSKDRCEQAAGFGTDHLGWGACKFHGGNNGRYVSNSNITHGKYAVKTRHRLSDQIDNYMKQDRSVMLDLTEHLAATRAIFDEFIAEYPRPGDDDYGVWFHRYTTLVGTLGSLVDKISKIDARNSLTAAQVLYIRAVMIDILMKWVPDENRNRAMKELVSRMGGELEEDIEMRPSEMMLDGQY